MMFILGSLEST